MRLGYTHTHSVGEHLQNICDISSDSSAIVRLMADDPFITQREIANKLNITKEKLLELVAEIRNSQWAQNYIIHKGLGTKYWTNTIAPLLETGTLHAAIENSWMYPNRIGLYTGLSCMFYCGFCGRNPVSKYESKYAKTGRDVFYQLIDQDPKTDTNWADRFRISGGLEPLTNPFLGDIITYGKNRGFKMQLYTNGNMMTPNYIAKHNGVLDLEAVRFSLYGSSPEKAYAVTKNKQSFSNIIDNVINYLNMAKSNKVGLNWIILPGHTADVIEFLDVVNYINKTANRPIDFVTLREDFSQNIRVLSDQERDNLTTIFQKIDDFKSIWSTYFDFGYSLEPLRNGINTGHIKMVNWDQMIPESFPQVAVAVDVKADVYVYHESCFIDRPGADRYIIGNIIDSSIETVTKEFVNNKKTIKSLPMDAGFMDAFDHVVTLLINQARDDKEYGIDWANGPVVGR